MTMIQDDYGNAVHTGAAQTISARLDAGDQRMTRIEENLSTNTAATQAVKADTAELVELFQSFKAAIKVLNWLGKLAKPMAYIVGLGTACIGLWAAMTGKK